ncbi:excinuclease ABC subunit UvrC [Desulfocurvibacter africanus]|uniref:UvrABC system protein C n=1 Tax=Desulfocurvibacter africanus subsp. africanus str. Walvis Bay TaxID=690850 RepID=F3Z3A0_DESAF|nr:excinuclease ABC subunit UvrC [Desulfocurvibacter africanus]EGJ51440.1 UvrABC system protein C [Desulfocurvibacter africanus subsp. africanus str. Walvis Bay]
MFTFESKAFSQEPGVYLMKNAQGRILYVGKAKCLRKRLASYFRSSSGLTPKTQSLVARIERIDTLITATEKEALLLEESLIKKHRPRYNVLLRDDKQYVLFRLDRHKDFPRLVMTRKVTRDGSIYYGPFTSSVAARETWKVINKVFPLRKCGDHVFANRVRPCLNYHIGRCLGPCVNEVDKGEYRRLVMQIEMLLSGRSGELMANLEAEMRAASDNLDFERAAVLRDQAAAVRRTVERQTVVLPEERDMDVMALAPTGSGLSLGLLFIRQGRLLGHKSFFFSGMELEDGPEVVASFLAQYYTPARFIPSRIVMPFPPSEEEDGVVQLLVERRGGLVILAEPRSLAEKELIDTAKRNALESIRSAERQPMTELLGRKLGLAIEPRRIECVDVSHLGGEGMRVGQIVYMDGEPLKDAYRTYSLPELEGTADDYLALASWAKRRVESGEPWPDLVLIDGGRGQLAAVERALGEAGQPNLFELASIAKAGRRAGELEDLIFRPGRKNPLPLKPGSPELLFLQRLRDAAHNYVLGRQRQGRRRQVLQSELLSLPSIGPKTARLLWERFDSVDAMLAAAPDEIKSIPGLGGKRAERILASLNDLRKSRAS